MDAITKAVYEIKFQIPKDILNLAFVNRYNYYTAEMISLDKLIIDNVINAKVLPDLNIIRGERLSIPLEQCEVTKVSPDQFRWETVIKVPPKLLNGRNIISPLSVVLDYGPQNSGLPTRTLQLAEAVVNTYDAPTGFSTTDLELIGNNTVLVHENLPVVMGYLNVMIENDRNMNNLNPRFYLHFAKLCVLATKAYIHNTLIVDLNKGLLLGGHELNVIKDIVDSYQDAIEQYEEYLRTKMAKVLLINDDKAYSRLVKMQVNPYL